MVDIILVHAISWLVEDSSTGDEKIVTIKRHGDIEDNSKTLVFVGTRNSTSTTTRRFGCLHGLKAGSEAKDGNL